MIQTSLILLVAVLASLESLDKFCKADDGYDPSEEREVPVKIKFLGDMATPRPDAGIDLGFVPKQVYYQVRRYDTQKRVPQSEAVKEARTAEELENAPRLREVVTHKKTQEVYEEQGYEDAGYDHGGSARRKEENERQLENDVTDFAKDSAPNHFHDEQEDQEDSKQPSRENRESDIHSDTLSSMNSDTRHRKIKPNQQEKDKPDTHKERKSSRGHKKRADSEKEDVKNIEKITGRFHKNKVHTLNKGAGTSLESSANRRIGNKFKENKKTKTVGNFQFDTEKYPFYNKLNSNKYTKHSALKYALNPKEIPVKVSDQMSFYNSRKLHCDDVTGPQVEVPDGDKASPDNSELKNPNRGKPRMGNLGQSIECLKRKFFGHDPLDNPFFKENLES